MADRFELMILPPAEGPWGSMRFRIVYDHQEHRETARFVSHMDAVDECRKRNRWHVQDLEKAEGR